MAYQTFVAFRNLTLPFLHQNKCVNAGLLKTRTPAKNSWLTSFPLPDDEFAFLLCFVFWFIFSDMACSTSQTRQKTENSRKQHVGQERERTGRLALLIDQTYRGFHLGERCLCPLWNQRSTLMDVKHFPNPTPKFSHVRKDIFSKPNQTGINTFFIFFNHDDIGHLSMNQIWIWMIGI